MGVCDHKKIQILKLSETIVFVDYNDRHAPRLFSICLMAEITAAEDSLYSISGIPTFETQIPWPENFRL